MTSLREFLSLPMDAGPNSRFTGDFDEFGRPIYAGALGTEYTMRETQPVRPGEALAQAAGAFRDDPLAATKNTVRALLQGAWNGIEAPGNALRGGGTQTYGDVADTALDWGVMSAATTAPRGAIRAGSMVDEAAETPAQTVARLLREGRASEVTDDLMAQVDPQEMARLYESAATGMDMPLDEASRMARAREMGMPFDSYHGSRSDADIQSLTPSRSGEIGPGVYHTQLPDYASEYSMRFDSEGDLVGFGQVMPLRTEQPNVINRSDWLNQRQADMDEIYRQRGEWSSDIPAIADQITTDRFGGSVYFQGGAAMNDQGVIRNPSRIRSRFARFDPRLSHLANLSAGVAAGGIMLHQPHRDADTQRLAAYLAENGGL